MAGFEIMFRLSSWSQSGALRIQMSALPVAGQLHTALSSMPAGGRWWSCTPTETHRRGVKPGWQGVKSRGKVGSPAWQRVRSERQGVKSEWQGASPLRNNRVEDGV